MKNTEKCILKSFLACIFLRNSKTKRTARKPIFKPAFLAVVVMTLLQAHVDLLKAELSHSGQPLARINETSKQSSTAKKQKNRDDIPERTLKFEPASEQPSLVLPPVTSVPQCSADGTLFLDMLDSKNMLKSHTVAAIRKTAVQTYPSSAITDLHDIYFLGFFPSETNLIYLVRASKENAVSPSSSTSPAGYPWSSYKNYAAKYKRDGTYEGSVELPSNFMLNHFAILPSGEFLVAGYDSLNSAARLYVLASSGEVVRSLDMPAARTDSASGAEFGSVEAGKRSMELMGKLEFTAVGQTVLVWSRETIQPILEVGPGGRTREVDIAVPKGMILYEMLSANDRWVAHYRRTDTDKHLPFSKEQYAYYELRPQDGSLMAKLNISGDVPDFIACESGQIYTSYKLDKDNKLTVYQAQ